MVGTISWITSLLLSALSRPSPGPSAGASEILALLVTPSSPGTSDVATCASSAYYGAYGRPLQHVYGLDDACLSVAFASLESGALLMPEQADKRTLIWLQDSGVDTALRGNTTFDDDMNALQESVVRRLHESKQFAQVLLGAYSQTLDKGVFEMVYRTPTAAIIAVSEDVALFVDMLLPEYVSPIALPAQPSSALIPVPPESASHIQTILKRLKFNPDIASILSTLSVDRMRLDIRHLTGEDGGGILSRHSFSPGARDAANWIQHQIEKTGADCRQEDFLAGYSPNVICRYPPPSTLAAADVSSYSSIVLLSAHYDSRGSFGSTRAPGGNDDGSGVTHLLSVAHAIAANSIEFTRHAVELVAFAGEEQGLRGSQAYARSLSERGANVTLMIQADMLAYHKQGEPAQLGLPDLIGLPEAAWLVANVSKIYSPELTVGTTPACCSDHQSFHSYGFPATQVYERAGPIVDPMYHNSGDVSDRSGYDLQQVRSIAKVTFATLLEVAGFTWSVDARQQ